jgi:hypothetical protein
MELPENTRCYVCNKKIKPREVYYYICGGKFRHRKHKTLGVHEDYGKEEIEVNKDGRKHRRNNKQV